MRAISALMWHITTKSLDDMNIPAEANVRALCDKEVRIVDDNGQNSKRAYIKNCETDKRYDILPDHLDPCNFNQLTLQLDSGAIGRAGTYFSKNYLLQNVFAIWGKIHRAVRDVRLATEHSENRDIDRALLHMNHVFSLHGKPFGSGAWYSALKETLNDILVNESYESIGFRHYGAKWAKDRGIELLTEDDWKLLFDDLSEVLKNKIVTPKGQRWFSFNERWEAHGEDFWAMKYILRHYFGISNEIVDGQDDSVANIYLTPKQELSELKSKEGAMKIGEKVMSNWLHDTIPIYFFGSKATWSWYNHQRSKVSSSFDFQGLRYQFFFFFAMLI